MRRGHGGKNKFKFVNGTIVPPYHIDSSFQAWGRRNNLVH